VKTPRAAHHLKRGNPFLKEKVHDPYRSRTKLREATSCPQCGVQYRNGRWIRPKLQTHALKRELCPACRRINDRYPAGEVVITGEFARSHRQEIISRAQHIEAAERALHPLHRIIGIDERDDAVVISTTDIHLPHQITHALHDAWGGETKTHYDLDGYFTRMIWNRNE
jgi:NMD protein affecting ribosome stability and mRNA decay